MRASRMRALVQRPQRKIHVASIGTDESTWLTICDRTLPVEGTGFIVDAGDAQRLAEEHEPHMCRRCYWYAVLAGAAVDEALARFEAALPTAARMALYEYRRRLEVAA